MKIKRALVSEVAAMIGADVLDQDCTRRIAPGRTCGAPLLMKPDQGMPFCWLCTTDSENAQRARTSLTKARLAERGISIGHNTARNLGRTGSGIDAWPEEAAL